MDANEKSKEESIVRLALDFRDTKEELPNVPFGEGFSVPVYFICDEVLYKGDYHVNGNFYAYGSAGFVDCFASVSGEYLSVEGKRKNSVCTHWCYVHELRVLIHRSVTGKKN